MKQPWWKIWLSYLTEISIERTSSEWNEYLDVDLYKGRYMLSTENAIYSFDDLYSNFSNAFKKLNLEQHQISKVLVLGLGLGSIPYLLENTFKQQYNYTVVEIDEEVIHLANKYSLSQLKSPIEFLATDAYSYIFQSTEQFGLICMDIFLDDVVPSKFEEARFLQALKQRLSPNGVLLYNRLALTSADKKNALDFFEQKFKAVFPDAEYWDVGGNYMLIKRCIKKGR